jgi:transposase InsO family protein
LHADNGVFTSAEFRDDMKRKGQQIRFSGVGAHHQNGIAERTIKTISYLARAQLIHAALRWPAENDLELWPFALQHATYIWNNIPGTDGLAPIEK